jgi:hypothetical protein
MNRISRKNAALLLGATLLTMSATGCKVSKTQEGEMPDVDVKVQGGQVPKYDVKGPKVDVKTKTEQVTVPTDVDVKTEKRDVKVPEVSVTPPK